MEPAHGGLRIMASEGYPGSYAKGKRIYGLEEAARLPNVKSPRRNAREGRGCHERGRVLGGQLGKDAGKSASGGV